VEEEQRREREVSWIERGGEREAATCVFLFFVAMIVEISQYFEQLRAYLANL
jgi:hypothetical protein